MPSTARRRYMSSSVYARDFTSAGYCRKLCSLSQPASESTSVFSAENRPCNSAADWRRNAEGAQKTIHTYQNSHIQINMHTHTVSCRANCSSRVGGGAGSMNCTAAQRQRSCFANTHTDAHQDVTRNPPHTQSSRQVYTPAPQYYHTAD